MPFLMSEIVNDPDFAQAFTITRSQNGTWENGIWVNATVAIPGYGVIQPTTPEELKQVPEADRVTGMVSFHSSSVIYETHTNGVTDSTAAISDTIAWNNQSYRVVKVFPWQDFGFYKAICSRMSGQ